MVEKCGTKTGPLISSKFGTCRLYLVRVQAHQVLKGLIPAPKH